jgi:ion channel
VTAPLTAVQQRRDFATLVREEPSAVLLLVQLAGVLLYPFMDESPVGRAAISLFSLVVLVLAVRTVRSTPALTWVSVLLGAPIVVLTLLEIVDPANQTLVLWSSLLLAAFYAYTTVGLMSYMFRDRFITPDELWAVAATFTVIAWAFAHAFMAVQVVWPGSFTASVAPDAPRTWFEMLFLSFTNLTSVGLSDIVPVLPQARSVVMIEQVAGLMYVAIVISRIVGLQLTRERRRREHG